MAQEGEEDRLLMPGQEGEMGSKLSEMGGATQHAVRRTLAV